MIPDIVKEDGAIFFSKKYAELLIKDAYNAGFNKGIKIELNFACIDGSVNLSGDDILKIKEDIRGKLK